MFSFCIPTEFVFGSGSFKKLYQYRMPGKKALIVTTNGGSVKRLGYLNELEKQLEKSDVSFEVFDGIEPNPITDNIMAAAAKAKETNCDFVIGFGGGSPMDSAKLIALGVCYDGDPWQQRIQGTFGITVRKVPGAESSLRTHLCL